MKVVYAVPAPTGATNCCYKTDGQTAKGLGREVGRSRKREGERERGGRAVGSSFVA